MTLFAGLAAALTGLTLLALLPALLSGAAVPRAWRTTAALVLALPLAGSALYVQLGRPDAMDAAASTATPELVQQMVRRLVDRLQRNPDDADGWALLARSYEQLGRPQDALPAHEQLAQLRPDDAAVWSQYAVTLALVKGEGLVGEPEALLQRALAVDPAHVPALALLAAAAQERGDDVSARGLWERVLALAPDGSEVAGEARVSLRLLGGVR